MYNSCVLIRHLISRKPGTTLGTLGHILGGMPLFRVFPPADCQARDHTPGRPLVSFELPVTGLAQGLTKRGGER